MDAVFFFINDALSSTLVIALVASVVWGVLSVLLSPCHLGTIPLVIGMVSSATRGFATRGRGTALSFAFAGGMLVALGVLGALVATMGYAVQRYSSITNYVIAVVFVAAGLNLLGILPLPLSGFAPKARAMRGLGGAAALGLVFGLGLSPCTFAFLAPILGMTFGSSATNPVRGMALLLTFGIGHCGVIGLAGSSTELVQRYLDWNEKSGAVTVLKSVCGVAVLVAAGALIYSA